MAFHGLNRTCNQVPRLLQSHGDIMGISFLVPPVPMDPAQATNPSSGIFIVSRESNGTMMHHVLNPSAKKPDAF